MGVKYVGSAPSAPTDLALVSGTNRFVLVTTGSEARPVTNGLVIWIGGYEQPINYVAGDVWMSIVSVGSPTPPSIVTVSLNSMTVGEAFFQTLTASGDSPITWTVSIGALPAGLSLDSGTGVLSGTPTTAGSYSFTIDASNSGGSDTQAYTGSVIAADVTHTIFGSSPIPGSLTTFNDGGGWVSNTFYITSEVDRSWYVHGARLYIPSGSAMIGQSGYVAVQRRQVSDGGLWLIPDVFSADFDGNGYRTDIGPLVAGWNDKLFAPGSLPMNSMDGIAIAYKIGMYYVHQATGISDAAIRDSDGVSNLYLSENGAATGQSVRSRYAGAATTANSYGIDIIVKETA